jgi:hypothetical protein
MSHEAKHARHQHARAPSRMPACAGLPARGGLSHLCGFSAAHALRRPESHATRIHGAKHPWLLYYPLPLDTGTHGWHASMQACRSNTRAAAARLRASDTAEPTQPRASGAADPARPLRAFPRAYAHTGGYMQHAGYGGGRDPGDVLPSQEVPGWRRHRRCALESVNGRRPPTTTLHRVQEPRTTATPSQSHAMRWGVTFPGAKRGALWQIGARRLACRRRRRARCGCRSGMHLGLRARRRMQQACTHVPAGRQRREVLGQQRLHLALVAGSPGADAARQVAVKPANLRCCDAPGRNRRHQRTRLRHAPSRLCGMQNEDAG